MRCGSPDHHRRCLRAVCQACAWSDAAHAAPAAPHREWRQHQAVIPVGPTQAQTERCARPVGHNTALPARFAAIRRVRAGDRAACLAAMAQESSQARLQSSLSASPRRSCRARCRRVRTPTACQSCSRRQHVMPGPPILEGSIPQGTLERRTKIIPASAVRSSTRARPPFSLADPGGRGAQSPHTEDGKQEVGSCQTNALTPILLGTLSATDCYAQVWNAPVRGRAPDLPTGRTLSALASHDRCRSPHEQLMCGDSHRQFRIGSVEDVSAGIQKKGSFPVDEILRTLTSGWLASVADRSTVVVDDAALAAGS